jgi:predicted dehydrogenase
MAKIPNILLVGAGRFGQHHLRVLKKLESEGKIRLTGVITRESGPRLTQAVLERVDGVVVVTPADTHYRLVKTCLPHTNVFVEKPLALKLWQAEELVKLARKHRRVLFVGHIYRFHPVILKLKKLLSGENPKTIQVAGRFLSPLTSWRGDNPALEKLHFFDVVDYLWANKPVAVWRHWISDSLLNVDFRYKNGVNTTFLLGWLKGEIKERSLSITTPQVRYFCDLPGGTIEVQRDGKKKIINCPAVIEPLEAEHLAFLKAIRGRLAVYPDGAVGLRVLAAASKASQSPAKQKQLRVAVIGGGIFGLTAALFLAKRHQVTIFEREADIMLGASRKNQYRHHVGYHYPRSMATIEEIQKSTKDFENFYGSMIRRDLPSYYAVEKEGSHVTGRQFIKVCENMNLPYKLNYPPEAMLNRNHVDTCVLTPEAVINYQKLTAWLKRQLAKNKNIILKTGSEVVGGKLGKEGDKILSIKRNGKRRQANFDFVLNATYSNYNQFCDLLQFPKRNLELRFKEVIVVKLPVKDPVAVTIMDGPFATLVPIDKTGLYTFGDVPLSMHVIADGGKGDRIFDRARRLAKSRWPEMRERCLKWFPILRKAEYVESMFVTLPVEKSAASTDARPTELTSHGFGCWSILSGKFITAVTAAKRLLTETEPLKSVHE